MILSPKQCCRLALVAAAILLSLLTAGCSMYRSTTGESISHPPATTVRRDPGISFDDALHILEQAEALAKVGDAARLCKMGGSTGNCSYFLKASGGIGSDPETPPVVKGSRVLPNLYCGNNLKVVGGRVLVLTGKGVDGASSTTDFMVMRWEGKLVPYNPVYWSGMRMSTPSVNCRTGEASGTTSATPTNP